MLSTLARSVGVARRLLRRPTHQKWLLAEAALTLLVVRITLQAVPFERWRHVLRQSPEPDAPPPARNRVDAIASAVNQVSQRWAEALPCLPRAIAVRAMMLRRHWHCQLQIGVARDNDGGLKAHAWVEHAGQIIIGDLPNLDCFVRLTSIDNTISRAFET